MVTDEREGTNQAVEIMMATKTGGKNEKIDTKDKVLMIMKVIIEGIELTGEDEALNFGFVVFSSVLL